jgi:hypothetical protein
MQNVKRRLTDTRKDPILDRVSAAMPVQSRRTKAGAGPYYSADDV